MSRQTSIYPKTIHSPQTNKYQSKSINKWLIQNNIWTVPRQRSIMRSSRTSIPWLSPDKHVSACKKPGTNIGSAFHHAAIYHLEINGSVCSTGKIYHNNWKYVCLWKEIFRDLAFSGHTSFQEGSHDSHGTNETAAREVSEKIYWKKVDSFSWMEVMWI